MGMIGQSMPGCFAEAAEECLICVLSVTDLQTLIHRNPQVGIDLLTEMARRLQEREADLERLAFAGIPARLAALLLTEASGTDQVSGLSHQDLADRIGTYRETVSQTLGKWKADGVVEVEQRSITIRDRSALEVLLQ
jgi:CRP-like cAMP-binding protein